VVPRRASRRGAAATAAPPVRTSAARESTG
jgi:hypothetical protein